MPIDLELDVLEDDEWTLLRLSAILRSYHAITPPDLRGVRIFDEKARGKPKEEFNYRKEQGGKF